jgi:4-amino-4-deoxy-L-arabinose transferase-like glycosyltransferase
MTEAREHDQSERATWADLSLLASGVLLIVGTGMGIRAPWPADEPRFALIAHDMVARGNWLFPRVGGELYSDKPPLFLWLLSIGQVITGSIRWSFLVPSFLASLGSVGLVYDLSRRLAGRQPALMAAGLLLCTVQFAVTGRSAQIDATLCFLTTLSLYALLRHLFWGPAWSWYFLSGVAAGLGIITKGVGFLPLLALIPYAFLRRSGFEPLPKFTGGARWLLAGVGLFLSVAIWLGPMLLAVANSHDPDLVAYRDGILLHQTVGRYVSAWHHRQPWYYFVVEVIPGLWLPFSCLLFWLIPRWRRAWLERDARAWLPLGWAVLVLLFFSLATGKRGIYILPALPAAVIASAPYLRDLLARAGVRRVGMVLACVVLAAAAVLALGESLRVRAVVRLAAQSGLDSWLPFTALAVACAVAVAATWRSKPILVWPATLCAVAIVASWIIEPRMDPERSGRAFMQGVQARLAPDEELALVDYKGQFLLYLNRPSVNFGHRLQDPLEEQYDAARWLTDGSRRVLLVSEPQLSPCFSLSPHESLGRSASLNWFLVRAGGTLDCIQKGNPADAIHYTP